MAEYETAFSVPMNNAASQLGFGAEESSSEHEIVDGWVLDSDVAKLRLSNGPAVDNAFFAMHKLNWTPPGVSSEFILHLKSCPGVEAVEIVGSMVKGTFTLIERAEDEKASDMDILVYMSKPLEEGSELYYLDYGKEDTITAFPATPQLTRGDIEEFVTQAVLSFQKKNCMIQRVTWQNVLLRVFILEKEVVYEYDVIPVMAGKMMEFPYWLGKKANDAHGVVKTVFDSSAPKTTMTVSRGTSEMVLAKNDEVPENLIKFRAKIGDNDVTAAVGKGVASVSYMWISNRMVLDVMIAERNYPLCGKVGLGLLKALASTKEEKSCDLENGLKRAWEEGAIYDRKRSGPRSWSICLVNAHNAMVGLHDHWERAKRNAGGRLKSAKVPRKLAEKWTPGLRYVLERASLCETLMTFDQLLEAIRKPVTRFHAEYLVVDPTQSCFVGRKVD